MIDRLGVGELEGWRSQRATVALTRLIAARLRDRENMLAVSAAAVDGSGTIDKIRRLSGAIEDLKWVLDQIATEGTVGGA